MPESVLKRLLEVPSQPYPVPRGLQHIHITDKPTCGCLRSHVVTDCGIRYEEMAHPALSWFVRVIQLTISFYRQCMH